MNISPINNITKRVLPLVATAAIGLGALTSCSSGNKTNAYSMNKDEIEMLDNTLDSLKKAKDDDKISFSSYYAKAKSEIAETHFEKANKMLPGDIMSGCGIAASLLGFAGLWIDLIISCFNESRKRFYLATALTFGGLFAYTAGEIKNRDYLKEQVENVEQYKAQKMEELEAERF